MKHIALFRNIVFLIAILFLLSPPAQAFSSCIDDNSRSLSNGGRNSYAWNDQYLFVAYGYAKENEYRYEWGNSHYSLSRVDRNTGHVTLISNDYPYFYFQLLMDGDTLYILREYYDSPALFEYWKNSGAQKNLPEFAEGDTIGTAYLIFMDLDGTVLNTTRYDFGSEIQDSLIHNGCLYVITEKNVFACDTQSGNKQTIYSSNAELYNLTTLNHAILCKNVIYLQEADQIIALNLQDNTSKYICTSPSLDRYPMLQKCHDYLVLGDYLYFWDGSMQEMVALNLNNSSRKSISDRRYSFANASEDGVAAYPVDDASDGMLFFRYPDPKYPCFATDIIDPIPVGATDNIILIHNNQYVIDDSPFQIHSLEQ